MDLNSLWIGRTLPVLQRLCLASAVATGARVRLFTYEPVEGIPPGVEVTDANQILGFDKMIRHRESQSVALFSDRFRYEILAKALGAWIDTDLLFLKAPTEDGECLLGWEDEKLIGSAFIWIKPGHPLIDDLRRFAADDYLIPPWLPTGRRTSLFFAKLLGRAKHVSDLDWGVIGPDLLTWLLQTNNMLPQARPKSVFSPLPWEDRHRISDGHFDWRALMKPETVCVHLWNWGLSPQLRTQRPEPGSLLDEVAQKCDFYWPDQ
jgi:hypothetical protein